MSRFALRRLLHALSLGFGVVLLLFLMFESGALGDPALREAGRHPSPSGLAATRWRLGLWERWEQGALELTLSGERFRLYVEVGPNQTLRVSHPDGGTVGQVATRMRNLGQLATELEALSLPPGVHLSAEIRGDAQLAAAGIATALQGSRAALDTRRSVRWDWAWARPAWKRFLKQSWALARLDFGVDRGGQPIAPQLIGRGLRSLALAIPAFLLGTLLALAAALWSLRRPRIERILGWSSAFALSLTSLAIILFLRDGLAGELGWFPVAGWEQPYARYLILPVICWVAVAFWPEYRIHRALLQRAAAADHLIAARARGLSERSVLLRHLLPNAAPLLLTRITLSLPFLVLGSVLLERVFAIPGLGALIADAALSGDQALLRAVVFLFAMLWLVAQWCGDLAAHCLDPRRRTACL